MTTTIGMMKILKNSEESKEFVITHYNWVKAFPLTLEGLERMLFHYINYGGY